LAFDFNKQQVNILINQKQKTKQMKKNLLLALFLVTSLTSVFAQTNALEYRRSSLSMIIADAQKLPSRTEIMSSWNSRKFPDKYNNHDLGFNSLNVDLISISDKDLMEAGFLKDTLKNPLQLLKALTKTVKYLNAENTIAVVLPSDEELFKLKIDKYIKVNDLGRAAVSKWFNRKSDGTMDWELIKERGKYSASAEKLDDAKEKGGLAVDFLTDWDLISNTYTVFYNMNFFPNEPIARAIRDAAKAEVLKGSLPEFLQRKALEGLDKVYEKTKEGYSVKCISYLYQLDWNADTAKKFKDSFFNNQIDKAGQMKAWNESSFKLNFVGDITSRSLVTFKLGEKRTEAQVIDLQMKRTMDNALAKLQKEYVQFRPVSPVASVGPLTARIGLKEGLEPGQSFEILTTEFDQFGVPKYKQIDKVKVDKKTPIWDNREGADQEPELDKDGNPIVTPEFTTFDGGKKAQPGLNFLRLLK
jgi:hypothetical protein